MEMGLQENQEAVFIHGSYDSIIIIISIITIIIIIIITQPNGRVLFSFVCYV